MKDKIYINNEIFNVDKAWESLNERIIHAETFQKSNIQLHRISKFYKIAALIVFCIALVISIYITIFNGTGTIQYSTNNNETRLFTLPDGTVAELNASSNIKFPKVFKNDIRNVIIKGEVFLYVTKDSVRPFLVETQNAKIRVLGTSFNIYAREDNKTEVWVEEGKVVVCSKNNENNYMELLPGDLGIVNYKELSQAKNENVNYLSWKTKRIVFKETSIKDVVSTLNRIFNCDIEILNNNLDTLQYSTIISNQPLDLILKALNSSFEEFDIKKKAKKYIIF